MKFIQILYFFGLFFICCKDMPESNSIQNQSTKSFEFITQIKWTENSESIALISGTEITKFEKAELPLKYAMVNSTSVLAYMNELDLIDKIIGVSQPEFIYNPKIRQRLKENKIQQIGSFDALFLEKILLEKPDVFFSISSPSLAKYHQQLINNGIKVLYIDEYEEKNPLAKAEYIVLIGKLFGKEKEARAKFEEIKVNYTNLKNKMENSSIPKPRIMLNQMYGDIWHMPSAANFQAKLIEDAGGDYIWKNSNQNSTLNLSFESVFEKASDADIWINAGDYPTKEALLASYPNYEWFQPVKNGKIYNWYNKITPEGANDYFETGTARPDIVLQDLAAIFHSELFPNYELYFYKQLK